MAITEFIIERLDYLLMLYGMSKEQLLSYLNEGRKRAFTLEDVSGDEIKVSLLKKIDDIGFCQLTSKDVVRHPLVQQIVQAYDAYEKKQKPERPARRRNGVNER